MRPRCPRGARRAASALVRDEGGATAVEFALLAPVLLLMLAGLVDASRLIAQSMQVKAAAQAGADYAQRHGWNAAGVEAAVVQATPLSVAAAPAPELTTACVSRLALVPATGPTCAAGGAPGRFVRVGASATFTPLFPWPGLPAAPSLTARALARVQ